jgi:hypothetical protein
VFPQVIDKIFTKSVILTLQLFRRVLEEVVAIVPVKRNA